MGIMSEQEAGKVFSHVVSLFKVFGGNLRQMCTERGVGWTPLFGQKRGGGKRGGVWGGD